MLDYREQSIKVVTGVRIQHLAYCGDILLQHIVERLRVSLVVHVGVVQVAARRSLVGSGNCNLEIADDLCGRACISGFDGLRITGGELLRRQRLGGVQSRCGEKAE